MTKRLFGATFLLVLALSFTSGCESVSAKTSQPPSDLSSSTRPRTGQAAQVFTLTTSDPASYSNSSGALEPMPSTSMTVNVQNSGFLTISFSARGSVAPYGGQIVPIVFIECQIDGKACRIGTQLNSYIRSFVATHARSAGSRQEFRHVLIPSRSSGAWAIRRPPLLPTARSLWSLPLFKDQKNCIV